MPEQAASDASFYALVHYVVEAQRSAEPPLERRAAEHSGFASLQFVAPYPDGRLPSEAEFHQVLCKDLSPRGLSYLTTEPPATEYVVAALGANSPLFLSAAVVRHWPLVVSGEELFLVAVRFIARIKNGGFGPLLPHAPPYAAAVLGPF